MDSVAAVVLAAGSSSRYGQPKQLLDWGGMPLVAHVALTALAAGLHPVVVVLGHAAEEALAVLAVDGVKPVMNWRWEEGLSTSVQAGLLSLPPDVVAAVFLQCDQPLVTPDLLRQLVTRHVETGAAIVHPVHAGQQSTPVLFARPLFAELASVTGDQGGRAVIARHSDEVITVEVDNPDLLTDIDTPAAYQRLRAAGRSAEQPEAFLAGVRHLVVDMDGVLWRGIEPVPGMQEFFTFIRERNIGFVLATNNASQAPETYARRLRRMGVEVPAEAVLTSAQAAAAYLATVAPAGTRVHALGMEGLHTALVERGFVLADDDVRFVVVGFAMDLTWQKLAMATLLIRQGAQFIGTNPDVTFPSEAGLVPGNGSTLAALQASTGVSPLVLGKPHPWLFQEAMRRMGAEPTSTAVIGDRLDTDIAGGINAGTRTILVLSGISTRSDLDRTSMRPDLVCAGVGELVQVWQHVLEQ